MPVSRVIAAASRAMLKLRFNTQANTWEVYATIHGTQVYRWFAISPEYKEWYVRNFPEIKIVEWTAS